MSLWRQDFEYLCGNDTMMELSGYTSCNDFSLHPLHLSNQLVLSFLKFFFFRVVTTGKESLLTMCSHLR